MVCLFLTPLLIVLFLIRNIKLYGNIFHHLKLLHFGILRRTLVLVLATVEYRKLIDFKDFIL